jgi:hypothetical protein
LRIIAGSVAAGTGWFFDMGANHIILSRCWARVWA